MTDLPHISIDFEGFHDKEQNIEELGWRHFANNLEGTFLVAISDGELTDCCHPNQVDWHGIADRKWVSHNRGFDKQLYDISVKLGYIDGDPHEDWECTADLAAFLSTQRNLQAACRVLLELEVSKDVRKMMSGLRVEDMMNQMVFEWTTKGGNQKRKLIPLELGQRSFYEDVVDYAKHDAILCWQLWDRYSDLWPEDERKASRLTTKQAHYGLQINVDLLRNDLQLLSKARRWAKNNLPWMAGLDTDEGALSTDKLKEHIGAEAPPNVKEKDPQYVKWRATHPEEDKVVQMQRHFRKTNIWLRRYEYIEKRLHDGRAQPKDRFSFAWRYGGAHTMRWAGGSSWQKYHEDEKGFNVQNIPKEPLWIDVESGAVVEPQTMDAWAVDQRALIIAPKGKKLIIADAEQIECRITKWLAWMVSKHLDPNRKPSTWKQDEIDLKKMASGLSPYQVHAEMAMGWTGGDIKKEDPAKQFVAKNRVLGLGFGCAAPRFQERCAELGHPINLLEAKNNVNGFRRAEKGIVALWQWFQDNMAFELKRLSQLPPSTPISERYYATVLPSGREIRYYNLRKHLKASAFPGGHPMMDFEATVERKGIKDGNYYGRHLWLFGAKLLENAAQGISRDILMHMMLNADDAGYCPLFTSHDEIILEVDQSVNIKDVIEVLQVRPNWDYIDMLPISVGAHESECYFK